MAGRPTGSKDAVKRRKGVYGRTIQLHKDIERMGFNFIPELRKIEPVDEETLIIDEVYCSIFGCGKKLTLIEKRYGNKCFNHQ